MQFDPVTSRSIRCRGRRGKAAGESQSARGGDGGPTEDGVERCGCRSSWFGTGIEHSQRPGVSTALQGDFRKLELTSDSGQRHRQAARRDLMYSVPERLPCVCTMSEEQCRAVGGLANTTDWWAGGSGGVVQTNVCRRFSEW